MIPISRQRLLFTAVTLLYWTSMYVYVPTLSPYLSTRGLSLQLIGIVLGSYGFMQLLIRFPLGMLSDKLGVRKPFILLGMLAACVSCLLFIVPGSWLFPLGGRAVSGISASAWVAFTVMYASYFEPGDAGKAMGNISVMTVSGQMLGMLISCWAADELGASWPFLIGSLLGLLGLLLALLLREPAAADGTRGGGISLAKVGAVLRTRTLLQVSFLSVLAHSILFITMFGFTPLKAAALGAAGFQLTGIVLAFMLPHAIASLFTAKSIAPRFGHWTTIGAGFLLSGISTAAMLAVHSLPMLALTQAVNGFAQGLHIPLLLGLAIRDVEWSSRATAMGLYQAIYAAGMFGGPFLAGWLSGNWGLDSGFLFGGLIACFAVALCLLWGRSERASLRRESPAPLSQSNTSK
ncbi:MFS transporter [Paenibacillus sp. NPDC058071]|uniref:MFS transporter n=1 Tax=Paenibacillus sp. NPDC058071 TaxID=3346326 RepID=UPI0036DCD9F5